MCAGPFIALLLSPPEKVQRKDGVRIVFRKSGWIQTLTEWYKVVTSRNVSSPAILIPNQFSYRTPHRSSFFAHYSLHRGSTVRTLEHCKHNITMFALAPCALLSFLGVISRVDSWLDTSWTTSECRLNRERDGALLGWWSSTWRSGEHSFYLLFDFAFWWRLCRVWTAIITKQLEDQDPVIDWTTSPLFGSTFSLFILFDLATMATQTSLYWIISQSALLHVLNKPRTHGL